MHQAVCSVIYWLPLVNLLLVAAAGLVLGRIATAVFSRISTQTIWKVAIACSLILLVVSFAGFALMAEQCFLGKV